MNGISKYGYILISFDLYNNYYDDLYQVFKKFKPVDMDYSYANRTIKMYGICEDFRELKEGETTPQYEAVIQIKDDGSTEVSFINNYHTNDKSQA